MGKPSIGKDWNIRFYTLGYLLSSNSPCGVDIRLLVTEPLGQCVSTCISNALRLMAPEVHGNAFTANVQRRASLHRIVFIFVWNDMDILEQGSFCVRYQKTNLHQLQDDKPRHHNDHTRHQSRKRTPNVTFLYQHSRFIAQRAPSSRVSTTPSYVNPVSM